MPRPFETLIFCAMRPQFRPPLATPLYNFTWHPEVGPCQDAVPQKASRRRDSRWRWSGRHARRCPAGRGRPTAQKESGGAGASGRCNPLTRSPRRRRTDPSQHHSCPGSGGLDKEREHENDIKNRKDPLTRFRVHLLGRNLIPKEAFQLNVGTDLGGWARFA